MARHEDNKAWGADNSEAGCLMSNIVPQHEKLNRGSWLALEDYHRNLVKDKDKGISELWVISGPIYTSSNPKKIGNDVVVPDACFKIVAWLNDDGETNAKAFILNQGDWDKSDLTKYLVSIDEIEEKTGLDFFPELASADESKLESKRATSL